MPYSQQAYQQARRIIGRRREKAENEAAARKEKCFEQKPELEKIENRMGQLGVRVSKVLFEGGDAKSAIDEMSRESLALQAKKAKLLREAGLPENFLAPKYTCPRCDDTGEDENRLCKCFTDLLKNIEKDKIRDIAPLDKCTLENFDVNYYPDAPDETGYSPRKLANSILSGCIKYCSTFSMDSKNLLFTGGTGLGKTHLSLAIVSAVIDKGYCVVYGGAQNVFNDLEKEHFNRRPETARYTQEDLLGCDLLVFDDLGSEFSTSFTVSCLYNIVNSRILASKPTIVNTNYTLKELENRYDQRIASRLASNYTILNFMGEDIRSILKGKK